MPEKRPTCPICGARSTWNVLVPQNKSREWVKVPDLCAFCKEEEARWNHDWIVGPDVVEGREGFELDPFKRC